jgi:death-on-curing protein
VSAVLEPLFLSLEEILDLHADQLRLFGGADGIRDRGALEAAVAMPSATFAGSFLHDGVFDMAAAYAFHIAENQPFLDGNKRTALNAALVFLYLNGWEVADPEMSLYDGMIGFSTHSLDKHGFARLLERLAVPVAEDESAL